MANLLGIIGGAGQGLSQWASTYQKTSADRENTQELARLNDELAGNRARALEQFKAELAEKGRSRMNTAIDTQSRGIIDSRMSGNGVADPSTWTPEQQAAREQGMARMADDPRTRAAGAAKAGYIDEAAKLDKIAESGASNVPWGATRVDGDGNVIYDAGSTLKGAIAQQAADAKTTAANTRAAGGKGAQFEEKQWDAAFKPDKSIVSMPTPLGDKDIDSAALRGFYKSVFNYARSNGEYSPAEANEYASTTVIKMRDKAMARAAASGGKVSPEQAASQILSEYQAALAKSREGGETTGSPKPAAGSQKARDSDRLEILQSELAAAQKRLDGGDTRAQGDIDALNREIAGAQGKKPKAAAPVTEEPKPKDGGKPATAPAAKTPETPRDQAEWQQKRTEAKALDAQIAEVRRDYNLATSVRGGKGVSDETKAKIKAKLDGLIAQQKDLLAQSDAAYMAADRELQKNRPSPGSNLNSKYQ